MGWEGKGREGKGMKGKRREGKGKEKKEGRRKKKKMSMIIIFWKCILHSRRLALASHLQQNKTQKGETIFLSSLFHRLLSSFVSMKNPFY